MIKEKEKADQPADSGKARAPEKAKGKRKEHAAGE
jgi:hypothetical protein